MTIGFDEVNKWKAYLTEAMRRTDLPCQKLSKLQQSLQKFASEVRPKHALFHKHALENLSQACEAAVATRQKSTTCKTNEAQNKPNESSNE